MNIYAILGTLTGALVGTVLLFIIMKYSNTNGKTKSEYDERQKLVRGKAYSVSAKSMIACCFILMILDMGGLKIPVQNCVIYVAIIMVGAVFQCTYCVRHGGYWAINNNKRRYVICFLLCAVIFTFLGVLISYKAGIVIDGELGFTAIIGLCAIVFWILGIAVFIQEHTDRKAAEEDDESEED